MIINKQLRSIPFDKLFEIYQEASVTAQEGLREQVEYEWQNNVANLESRADTGEGSLEVSLADTVQRRQVDYVEYGKTAGQKAIVDIWMPRYKLNTILVSVMPQIMALLAHRPLRIEELLAPATTEQTTAVEGQGLICGKRALEYAFDFQNPWYRGLYLFLMLDTRSSYLSSQYKGEARQYCSLVPLIPYALRLHHKVPYSRWDPQSLHWVVNKSLCQAMLFKSAQPFTREQLLEAREKGLVFQSGANAGTRRNPETSFKLWSTRDTCMHGVPHLTQVMLTQIWCAHPQNRSHYMVLDPENWDRMPVPLVSENIFKTTDTHPWLPKNVSRVSTEPDLPWLL